MLQTLRSWLGSTSRKTRTTARSDKATFAGLESLDTRVLPAVHRLTALGAAAGAPGIVTVTDGAGNVQYQFAPYGDDFTGGVRVAVGDVTGDGISDVVTAPGPGFAPQVNVYDGLSGQLVEQFQPFEDTFLGGVNVSVGNLGGGGWTTSWSARTRAAARGSR